MEQDTMQASIPMPPRGSTPLPSSRGTVLHLLGIVVGALAVSLYFMLLVPKPEPVVVEKIVEKKVEVPMTKPMPPARSYTYRLISTLDDKGATTTLSLDDAVIVDTVHSTLKKNKNWAALLKDDPNAASYIVVSGNYAITNIGIPKDSAGNYYFIIDLEKGKLLENFSAGMLYFMDKGTFVYGTDSGLRYYSYGASSTIALLNSSLKSPQTYYEYEGPMGVSGFKVLGTTTESITFGVYDAEFPTMKEGDDTAHLKQVGERTFIIPQ
jgi:hypothetical protein